MFFGSLVPVVGFLFTMKICRNIRIALLAALLRVFHPDLVQYSGQPLRECPYLFFEGLLLLLIVDAAMKNALVKWAVCGIVLSLATYCRFEALEFTLIVPLVMGALWYFKRIDGKEAVRNAAAFYLLFLLAYVLLLACVHFDYEYITRPLGHVAQMF